MDTLLNSLSLGTCKLSQGDSKSKEMNEITNSIENKIQSISDFSDSLPNPIEDVETKRGRTNTSELVPKEADTDFQDTQDLQVRVIRMCGYHVDT
jgi:hypothetical protein